MGKKRAPIIIAKYSVAGIAIQVSTYLIGLGGFVFAAIASARENFALGLIALGMVVGASFLARLGRRLRSKIVHDLPTFVSLLEKKEIPLILYLRAFHHDLENASWKPERGIVSTWEESLMSELRAYGAVLAVGIQGEILPPGGAYRVYLKDKTWRSIVDNLMDSARAIVYRCGDTLGVIWELEQLVRKNHLSRTIFASSGMNETSAAYEKLRNLGLPGTDRFPHLQDYNRTWFFNAFPKIANSLALIDFVLCWSYH